MAAHPESGQYWQPKRRGPIRGFSRAARARMLEKTAGIDLRRVPRPPLFVTLTYPEEFPRDASTVKRHLRGFEKRLLRRFPRAAVVWKLELQQRGAPHAHLMVYNVPFLRWQWVAAAWTAVCNCRDARHLQTGTETRRCRSHRQALYYAAKYMGKAAGDGDAEAWGRRWGIWNARCLPLDLVVRAISEPVAHIVRRWLWRYQRAQGYRRRGRRGRWDGTKAWLSSDAFSRLIAEAEWKVAYG